MMTIDFTDNGKCFFVGADAYLLQEADVAVLPTRKMQKWCTEQGTRVCRTAHGFRVRAFGDFDPKDAA